MSARKDHERQVMRRKTGGLGFGDLTKPSVGDLVYYLFAEHPESLTQGFVRFLEDQMHLEAIVMEDQHYRETDDQAWCRFRRLNLQIQIVRELERRMLAAEAPEAESEVSNG